MRPNKLYFTDKGQAGCYSIIGQFDEMQNFVEFAAANAMVCNMAKDYSIPRFEIAGDVWVQFIPDGWNDMTFSIAQEMVETWNERYSDNKFSPIRDEIQAYHSAYWEFKDSLDEFVKREDIPESVKDEIAELIENTNQKINTDWDIRQTKVKSLEAEIERLRLIIKGGS